MPVPLEVPRRTSRTSGNMEKEPQEEPGVSKSPGRVRRHWGTSSNTSAEAFEVTMEVPEIPAFCPPPPPAAGRKADTVKEVRALGELLGCKMNHMEQSLARIEVAVERVLCGRAPSKGCKMERMEQSLARIEAAVERARHSARAPAAADRLRYEDTTAGGGAYCTAVSEASSPKQEVGEQAAQSWGSSPDQFRLETPMGSESPADSECPPQRPARPSEGEASTIPGVQQVAPANDDAGVTHLRRGSLHSVWPSWAVNPEAQECAELETEERTGDTDVQVSFKEVEARGLDEQGVLRRDSQDCHTVSNVPSIVTDRRSCWLLQKLVLLPTSNPILIWHTIGPILLAYDIITIPMQAAFPLPNVEAWQLVATVTTSYWSLDVVRCFLTGYETDKAVEMRPSMIAARYLRGWFSLDAMTCTADWTFLIVGSGGMFNKFWRTSRAVQAWRVLRLVRLVRVLKFARSIHIFTATQVTSVRGLITLKSLYVGFGVAFFCHYAACYWYMVGDMEVAEPLEPLTENSWIVRHGVTNATLLEVYVSSFHWAMGQSGFAPTEIFPTNTMERLYASAVSFCWLIIMSVTINLFSIWLGHLHESNKDREQQNFHLRKFLEEHEVTRKLSYKVMRYFRAHYDGHRHRRTHEEDVAFLRDLPISMKIKLRREVFLPILKKHPFFTFIGVVNPTLPIMITYCAMREERYLPGEVVFVEGTLARQMLFVHIGRLDYYAAQMLHATKLEAGDWACEPALWLRWTCRGRLVTERTSEIVGVDVERFTGIMHCAKARGEDVGAVKLFAKSLCKHFCRNQSSTDLWTDKKEIQERAQMVLASEECGC